MAVARRFLGIAGVVWLLVAGGCLTLAVLGRAWIAGAIPDLAIDGDAIGGALVGIAGAALLVGLAHLAVWRGLGHGERGTSAVAILLAAAAAATFIALASSAAASAGREANLALPLTLAALASALIGLGYAFVAWRLVRARGSRTRI